MNLVQRFLRETFVGRLISPVQGLVEASQARLSEIEHDDQNKTPGGWARWATPGWYVAMPSRDLPPGRVTEARIGGKGLAIFRTESGKPVAVDLYCPHFGGNLGTGRVVGETVECPFHRWRYDTSGTCIHIPGCPKIPAKARLQTYPVVERFGCVWLFVGDHKYYELPSEDEVFEGPYMINGIRDLGTVRVDCRDIYENFLDVTHAKTIHNYDVKNYQFLEMDVRTRRARFSGDVYLTRKQKIHIESFLYGTGLFVANFIGGLYRHKAFWMIGAQPVEALRTRIFLISAMRPRGHRVRDRLWSRWYFFAHSSGASADIPIWNNKVIQDNPVLCALDVGPIRKFRRYWATLDQIGRTGVEPNGVTDFKALHTREQHGDAGDDLSSVAREG